MAKVQNNYEVMYIIDPTKTEEETAEEAAEEVAAEEVIEEVVEAADAVVADDADFEA